MVDEKKRAGVRFSNDLHIYFIYNPETDTVEVYRNGELISSGGGVTPEELMQILEGYVTKDELAEAFVSELSDYITSEALTTALSSYVQETDFATDDDAGVMKTDSTQNITLDENGNLVVGGRLGQTEDLGLYNPIFADPVTVGFCSLLMSEAKGLSCAHREFIIAGGSGLNLKTVAQAGATEYRLQNTQNNRFIASCYVGDGSVLTIDQEYAKEKTVPIVSCKFANGDDVTPYFGDTENDNDIIITTSESINPDNTINNIRCYGSWNNSDVISVGQGNRASGGKTIQIGQALLTGQPNRLVNQVLQLGNRQYANRNNNIMIGNDLISKMQFWIEVGQGHDNSDGKDGGAVFGLWSLITENTKLAVGNGTAYNKRSNIFEVQDNAGVTGLVVKSPNKTFNITVDDAGTISATEVI